METKTTINIGDHVGWRDYIVKVTNYRDIPSPREEVVGTEEYSGIVEMLFCLDSEIGIPNALIKLDNGRKLYKNLDELYKLN